MHRTARAGRTPAQVRTTARPLPSARPFPTARLFPTALALATVLALALMLWSPAPTALADPSEQPATERGYRAVGPEVVGGGSQAQAPLLTAGLHRDSLAEGGAGAAGAEGTVKYYRVEVGGGQRLHAAATIAAPPFPDGLPEQREDLGLDLEVLTAGGDLCTDGGSEDIGAEATGDGPITTTVVSDVMGWDGCAGDELFLRVARTGTRAAQEALPVEIQIALEPAGLGGGAPAVDEPIEDDGAAPVPPADEEPLEPGRSFATATEVTPGSHVLELRPGEAAMLRLEVQEGQRLRWRTEVTSLPEGAGDLSLTVSNPVRDEVAVDGGRWTPYASSTVTGGGMTAPVELGNRSSTTASIASAWLPGTHTVGLQRRQLPEGAEPGSREPIVVVLTLELDGQIAQDAADGDVLELGEPLLPRGPLSGLGLDVSASRLLMMGGAGGLSVLGVLLGISGLLVLRMRRG